MIAASTAGNMINEFVVSKLGATELNIVVTGSNLIFVLLFFLDVISLGPLDQRAPFRLFLDWDCLINHYHHG